MSSTTGLGHVLPMVPLVRELADRGHEVMWVGGTDDIRGLLPRAVRVTVAGIPERERQATVLRLRPDLPSLPPQDRRSVAFVTAFAKVAATVMVGSLRDAVQHWRPDVIVHEAAELAAPLVAAGLGIPSVCHGFGEIVPGAVLRSAGTALAPAWEAAGLAPDPYAGSYRGLYVDIYPPSLRGEATEHVSRVQPSRPAEGVPADGPTIYVTFGTMFNKDVDVVRAAALGAAAAAQHVVVTVGRDRDVAALGRLPAHVRVETFIPQAEVLPRCAAVVCHGGSGTLLAALAHGLPVVCVPQGADQFTNALNVERAGAGLALVDPTEHDIRVAVEHARSPHVRARARAIAREIAAMPPTGAVADAVELHAAGLGQSAGP